jgi:hypothetical protein
MSNRGLNDYVNRIAHLEVERLLREQQEDEERMRTPIPALPWSTFGKQLVAFDQTIVAQTKDPRIAALLAALCEERAVYRCPECGGGMLMQPIGKVCTFCDVIVEVPEDDATRRAVIAWARAKAGDL